MRLRAETVKMPWGAREGVDRLRETVAKVGDSDTAADAKPQYRAHVRWRRCRFGRVEAEAYGVIVVLPGREYPVHFGAHQRMTYTGWHRNAVDVVDRAIRYALIGMPRDRLLPPRVEEA